MPSRFLFILYLLSLPAIAADWPTYQYDYQRSGVTEERLEPPLALDWTYNAKHPPTPAWPPPAKQDFWHHKRDLHPRMIFDRAFHVAVKGNRIYFGSSTDDKIYCLDAASGKEIWSFFTDGPVRLAPSVHEDRVYAGSDDGAVYCLDAASGSLVWKRTVAPDDRRVIGNGRMISVAPVRTGVMVLGGRAYCCAGIFPLESVHAAALDARTGKTVWRRALDLSPQGYMLASRDRLYVPTGRTSPAVLDKRNGELLGALEGSAGAYALVTDELVIHGPGDSGLLGVSDSDTRDHLASFDGLHMIIKGEISYLHGKNRLSALNRKEYLRLVRERNALIAQGKEIEKRLEAEGEDRRLVREREKIRKKAAEVSGAMPDCMLWIKPCAHPFALVLAKDVLFAGGEDEVAAFSTADGRMLWKAGAQGRAYGLAVAGGRLFVSTDQGAIHCFTEEGR